jgi:hypothetical protein
MSSFTRLMAGPAAALCILLAGCASDDGYGGYGGVETSVAVGYGYYDGYYPYYGYPPGYGCCWYGDDGRPIEVPPGAGGGDRPDRPTTLPARPEQLPAQRPSQPSTRPAPSTRPSTGASSRPAPRPTPRPMGGGGGRRR